MEFWLSVKVFSTEQSSSWNSGRSVIAFSTKLCDLWNFRRMCRGGFDADLFFGGDGGVVAVAAERLVDVLFAEDYEFAALGKAV